MKKSFLFILFIPILVFPQFPKDIINQSCYGTSEEEEVRDMIATEHAIYILSRTQTISDSMNNEWNYDILLTKTKINGDLVWQKTYGGSLPDFPASIIEDNEGYIYIGGSTYSTDGDIQSGNKGGEDVWIIKLDTSGTILWERTYGGAKNDYSGKLLSLENGNMLLYTASLSSDYDVEINYGFLDLWFLEFNTNGDIINSKSYGSSNHDNLFSLIQTTDGGFFTAARAGANDGSVNGEPKGGNDVWLLKLDASLNIEWQKLIGGSLSDGGGYGVTELANGGYIFNGRTRSSDKDVHGFDFPDVPDQWDNWVVRLDSVGNIIWDIALGGDSFESSSKVFANNDGTFTVFGSTKSMNNGDVEGHHYHQSNPNFPNYDIWMVKLNEFGEIIDQRCFGNTGNDMVYRGIIKKSDNHYLLAGTAWSLPDDTIGDVNGGYESDSYDIWFFEKVDCDYFQPATPIGIEGESIICTDQSIQTTYETQIVNPKYEEAQWLLEPEEAGEMTNFQDSVIIQWNTGFIGQAELKVRSTSNCGESAYTKPMIIYINPESSIPGNITGQEYVCSPNTPANTYHAQINNPFYETAEWQLQPEEAGQLSNMQDTVLIQWNTGFEGLVELKVRSINDCGSSEYTEPFFITVNTQANIPASIIGQDTVCTINTSTNTYTTQIANPQLEEAEWQLLPPEAGQLTNLQDSALIQWHAGFEGQVELKVRSISYCEESEYTEPKIIEVRSCVGIDEIKQSVFKIYPNPANEYFIIDFSLPNNRVQAELQLINAEGKIVLTEKVSGTQGQHTIDVRPFKAGAYIIRLISDEYSLTKSIIIE